MKDAEPSNSGKPPTGQSLQELVEKLCEEHTRFLKQTLPELQELAFEIQNPPLVRFLENLSDELHVHFRMEERLVFPLILSRLDHPGQAIEPALRLACDHMREDHRTHMKHLQVLQAFRQQLDESRYDAHRSALNDTLEKFCLEIENHCDLENKWLFHYWPMLEDESTTLQ
ncbi:MAG: hemerythrin domain-containing protein [Leptospiraceae bacterium]